MKFLPKATATAVILLAFPTASGYAQFSFLFDWGNPGGGSYANQFNWSSISGGIPDSTNEIARFQIDATYSVQVSDNYTVDGLAARQQGNVTLAFDPPSTFVPRKIYNTVNLNIDPTAGSMVDLTLVNGDVRVSGDTTIGGDLSDGQASLNLVSALLTTAGARVADASATTGHVTVDASSRWTSSEPLTLGGAGDSTLDIQASFRTSCFVVCITSPAQGFVSNVGVTLASGSPSSSTADVYGIWETGDLIVGDQGSAEVNVLGTQLLSPTGVNVSSVGGLMSSSANIGARPGSSGKVSITGAAFANFTLMGSTWDIAESLTLAGSPFLPGGSAHLTIGPLNTVTVGDDLKMWPGSTLLLAKNAQFSILDVAHLGGALEFAITDMTQPQLNDMFQILTAGSVVGTFDSAMLPALSQGLRWDILYNPTNVQLKVVAGQSGDFDNDGDVDGHDFLLWQRNPAIGNLADWQANFGAPQAARSVAVPEPSVWMAFISGLFSFSLLASSVRRYRAEKIDTDFDALDN